MHDGSLRGASCAGSSLRSADRECAAGRDPLPPGIYKRGGRYSLHVHGPSRPSAVRVGRRRWRRRRSKAAKTADVARVEFRGASKADGRRLRPVVDLDLRRQDARGINPDTMADYRKALGLDPEGALTGGGSSPYAGRLRMVEVTPADVKWLRGEAGRSRSRPNTVRLALAPVKAMFADAVEDTTIRWNPAAVRGDRRRRRADEDGRGGEGVDARAVGCVVRGVAGGVAAVLRASRRVRVAVSVRRSSCGGRDVEVPDHPVIEDGQTVGGLLRVCGVASTVGRVAPPKAGSPDLRLEASRARALRDLAATPESLVHRGGRGRIEPVEPHGAAP